MNFAQLMTFWQMKGYKMKETVLYERPVYGTDRFHAVIHLQLDTNNHITHIVYKSDNGRMRLLNADIMFKSYGDKDDEIWIKKATIHQLSEYA